MAKRYHALIAPIEEPLPLGETSLSPVDVAQTAAPSLAIDLTPVAAAHSAAPDLSVDLTAPRTPDTPVKGEDITPESRQIAASAAKDLGIDFGEADPTALDLTPDPMKVDALGALRSAMPGAAARKRVETFQVGKEPTLIQDIGRGYGGRLGGAIAGMVAPPDLSTGDPFQEGMDFATMVAMPGEGGIVKGGRVNVERPYYKGGADVLDVAGDTVTLKTDKGRTIQVQREHVQPAEIPATTVDPAHAAASKAAPELGLPESAPTLPPSALEAPSGYAGGALPPPAGRSPPAGGGAQLPPVRAAVRIEGKVYEGDTHAGALEEAQRVLGPDNPAIARSLENESNIGYSAGDLYSTSERAINVQQAVRAQQLGLSPPDLRMSVGPPESAPAQPSPGVARTPPGPPTPPPPAAQPPAAAGGAPPFTARPPPPAAAEAAARGMPPPGVTPPAPPGAPPRPPRLSETPAPFLEGAPTYTPGPMNPKRVTEMENDLFAIKSADRGRKEVIQTKMLPQVERNLEHSFGRDAATVDRQVYHDREAGRPVEPRAQAYDEKVIEPLHQQNTRDIEELRRYNMPDLERDLIDEGRPVMHRVRIGKTRGMDEASGLGETVGYKGERGLSTRPSGTQKRTILAMEDEAGNHKVIVERPGGEGVGIWQGGKLYHQPGGFVRTTEPRKVPGREIPGRTTLEKPVVARVEPNVGLTKAYYKEPKEIADRTTQDRTTEPKLTNDRFRRGSEFVDMNNKRWFIRDATTAEIHAAGVRDIRRTQIAPGQFRIAYGEPVKFYESALASELTNHLALKKALDTARFRAKWQASPEFKERSVATADATPEQRRDWTTIPAPGWEGRYYEPRFAEPIMDHLAGQGYRIPLVDPASNFATSWLFKTGIGSIAHGWNEHFQRMLARGVTGNVNVVARAKTALQAFDETRNKGPIWQDYRNRGASFPSDSHHWRSVEESILRATGNQLKQDPGFKGWAKRHGLYSDEAGNIWAHAIGKAVFEYGDFITFQHGLELERRGFTRDQAIARMNRVLPTYRIPSRIITKGEGGRVAARVVASPSLAQFGRYTYSRFKALSSIVEDIAGKDKSFTDRKDGLDRLITTIAIFSFVSPFVDKALQKATGDKDMHFLWGGPLGMVARAVRTADDVREGRKSATDAVLDSLTGSVNLGPFIKEAIQQYTGRDLYNDRQFVAPTDSDAQNIAERAAHIGGTFFAPTQIFADPMRALVEDPLRLSTARPYDPTPRSRGGAKREEGQRYNRFERLPAIIRKPLEYGGFNR